jgi:hypothetical protein
VASHWARERQFSLGWKPFKLLLQMLRTPVSEHENWLGWHVGGIHPSVRLLGLQSAALAQPWKNSYAVRSALHFRSVAPWQTNSSAVLGVHAGGLQMALTGVPGAGGKSSLQSAAVAHTSPVGPRTKRSSVQRKMVLPLHCSSPG